MSHAEHTAVNAKIRRWLADNILVRGGLVDTDIESLNDFDTQEDTIRALEAIATDGNITAQTILGFLYSNRIVITADKESGKGVHWLRLASEQGSKEAQTVLGSLYSTNRRNVTIKWSLEEAAKWYAMAAEQGSAEAQFTIGAYLMYKQPREANQAKALKWLILSALQNNDKAIETLKFSGSGITAAQKEKARELARQWLINRAQQ